MSAYSFSLKSPRDLLEKGKREFKRLESSSSFSGSDPTEQVDHAWNLAITLWHIVDWLWRSPGAKEKAMCSQLGFQKFEDLHRYVRKRCGALDVCYEVATGSKHFEFSGKTAATRVVSDTRVSAGPTTTIGRPLVNVLKITVAPGKDLPALDIFQDAIAYWELLFSAHKL